MSNLLSSTPIADIEDYVSLYGTVSDSEQEKIITLLKIASDKLRQAALNRGKDLDELASDGKILQNVAIEVVCRMVADFVGRLSNLSTMGLSQVTESALGVYSMTGTYAVPGGGMNVMNKDLAALGISRPTMGVMFLGYDPRTDDNAN